MGVAHDSDCPSWSRRERIPKAMHASVSLSDQAVLCSHLKPLHFILISPGMQSFRVTRSVVRLPPPLQTVDGTAVLVGTDTYGPRPLF